MQWQARVRQTFKRKEIEMALLEFSQHQKKNESKDQEKKLKRAKTKSKEHDGIASDGVSDEENDV